MLLAFHLRAGPTILALYVGETTSGKTIASDFGRAWGYGAVTTLNSMLIMDRFLAWVAEQERPIADRATPGG
jgi:hypothetical protein